MTRGLLLATGLWLAAGPAWTAEGSSKAAPDPADPTAPTSALHYDPVFKGYEPFRDVKRIPWKDANRTVGQVGGHAGALKSEADAAADPPPSSQSGESETPKAAPLTPVTGHGAHHGG